MVSFFLMMVALRGIPSLAAPDTSLRTIPVAYYGANWNRSQANLEMLAKQRIVVLMQEDGECWLKCCPDVEHHGIGVCQPQATIATPNNASRNPGCNPACDQHGKQAGTFQKVKDVAKASGRSPPHCMMYMNGVYDWPFDAAHAAGADVLGVDGEPHAEVCDPGIYPSYLLDFGREEGQNAFMDEIRNNVVNGAADGVFLDNFAEVPMNCKDGTCTAIRNHWASTANKPTIVTQKQVDAYTAGKSKTLTAAGDLINSVNGAFAAFTWPNKPNTHGANMAWFNMRPNDAANASVLSDFVKLTFQNGYKYLGINQHRFREPGSGSPTDADMVKSECSDYQLATFLLAWEEGCFLICNGWSDDFDRPVGEPLGPATIEHGVMTRKFAAGVKVEWIMDSGKTNILWASQDTVVV